MPKDRNSDDLEIMATYFQQFPLFEKLKMKQENDYVKRHTYKAMEMQTYNKHDIVFNFGDTGELFYIIFTGSVGVLVPFEVEKSVTQSELIDYIMENREFVEPTKERGDETEVLNKIIKLCKTGLEKLARATY